ncbi:MAG: cardiolipin synthase B [Acidobacteria bacterium]|nr:cardiolipin synthase B [Acidobacteriota bacterium]
MRTAASRHIAADLALSRAAGAPLIDGNAVRVLRDGAENYPAWLDAIAGAERFIHFDSYILHDDRTGRLFADALAARARAGVRVRVLYDWVGAVRATSRAYWYRLREAGVEVRGFNRPVAWRPLAWLSRDHRKMLAVDGRVAYVSGLCVGDDWVGTADMPPWRDTGVEILGPAVADIHAAFAEIWDTTGAPLPPDEQPACATLPRRGSVALRVIGSTPATAAMLRLDVLVAGLARERLWITDAYFVGVPGYVQALTAAAADGVDVRLLVPGATDLPLVRSFTRAGYRGLLEGGVRVFEWNGSMVHAKSAVADGLWGRVGSTNLNLQSWMGNWELDVAIEDAGVATDLERMFERDLEQCTEVVLDTRRRIQPVPPQAAGGGPASPAPGAPGRGWRRRRGRRGSSGKAAAGALRLGNTVGAALTARRSLGTAEAPTLVTGGTVLLGIAALAVWWPALLAYPAAGLALWLGLSLLGAAWRARAGRT